MKKQTIVASMLVVGFLAGATALSTLADWSSPLSAPPTCVAGNPGCDAPINVGDMSQVKTGLIGLNDLIVKNMQVLTASGVTSATKGSVLSAIDSNGTVGWVATSSLGISNTNTDINTIGKQTIGGGCYANGLTIDSSGVHPKYKAWSQSWNNATITTLNGEKEQCSCPTGFDKVITGKSFDLAGGTGYYNTGFLCIKI